MTMGMNRYLNSKLFLIWANELSRILSNLELHVKNSVVECDQSGKVNINQIKEEKRKHDIKDVLLNCRMRPGYEAVNGRNLLTWFSLSFSFSAEAVWGKTARDTGGHGEITLRYI